jgi:hypothetical protein
VNSFDRSILDAAFTTYDPRADFNRDGVINTFDRGILDDNFNRRCDDQSPGAWTSLGLEGGTVSALAFDQSMPGTVYAGLNYAGVFKSTNGGDSWTRSASGLPQNVTVRALAVDPQTGSIVYAGTDGWGVYRSGDGGATWSRTGEFPFVNGSSNWQVLAVVVDPTTPTTIYAVSYSGLYKSTNSGGSWTVATTGLPGATPPSPWPSIGSLVADPSAPGVLYVAAGGTVYRSADGAASWQATGYPGPYGPSALAVGPSGLYAGRFGDVLRSVDGGAQWTSLSAGLPAWGGVRALVMTDAKMYAVTDTSGVYTLASGGSTWTAAGSGLPSSVYAYAAAAPRQGSTVLVGYSALGVFTSSDGGTGWRTATSGMEALNVREIKAAPSTPSRLYLAVQDGPVVFASEDGGRTWAPSAIPDALSTAGANGLAVDPGTATTVYAATSNGLYKSTDGARTWTRKSMGTSTGAGSVVIDPVTPSTLYATTFGPQGPSLLRSHDGGDTWTTIGAGLPTQTGGGSITFARPVVDPTTPTTLYIGVMEFGTGGSTARVFRSTDGGSNWTVTAGNGLSAGGPCLSLAAARTTPTTLYAGTACPGGRLLRSVDGGANWVDISPPAMSQWFNVALAAHPVDPATVIIAGQPVVGPHAILKSTNSGETWATTSASVPGGAFASSFELTASTMYLGTQGGGAFSLPVP